MQWHPDGLMFKVYFICATLDIFVIKSKIDRHNILKGNNGDGSAVAEPITLIVLNFNSSQQFDNLSQSAP